MFAHSAIAGLKLLLVTCARFAPRFATLLHIFWVSIQPHAFFEDSCLLLRESTTGGEVPLPPAFGGRPWWHFGAVGWLGRRKHPRTWVKLSSIRSILVVWVRDLLQYANYTRKETTNIGIRPNRCIKQLFGMIKIRDWSVMRCPKISSTSTSLFVLVEGWYNVWQTLN